MFVHATLLLQLRFITLSVFDVPKIPLYVMSLNLTADVLVFKNSTKEKCLYLDKGWKQLSFDILC